MKTQTDSEKRPQECVVSAKLPGKMAVRFDALCQELQRSRSYIIRELIKVVLEEARERQKRASNI